MCTGAELLAFGGDMALSWGLGEIGNKLGVPWLDDVAALTGFGVGDIAKGFDTDLASISKNIGFDDLVGQGNKMFNVGTGFLDDLYAGADKALGGTLSKTFGDTGFLSGVGNVIENVVHDPAKLAKTIAGGYIGNDLGGVGGALLGAGIGSGEIPFLNNPKVQKLANTFGMGYIGNELLGTPGAIIGAGYGAGAAGQPINKVVGNVLTDIGLGKLANAGGNLLSGLLGGGAAAGNQLLGGAPGYGGNNVMNNPFNQQQVYQPISSNYQGPGFSSEAMIQVPISTVADILKKKEA